MIAGPVFVGGDLGRKRDLTSVVAVERVAARRELGNEFVEDSESFLPGALIEAAIEDDLVVLA